jgi:hypothetical protein
MGLVGVAIPKNQDLLMFVITIKYHQRPGSCWFGDLQVSLLIIIAILALLADSSFYLLLQQIIMQTSSGF